MKANMVRVRVSIRGTRPLLQHAFGPETIPLEKQEKEGVAGNDPGEWKRSCMVTADGQLYVRGDYVFSCLRDAAKHTKKGKGSLQAPLAATLQVEDTAILLNRWMPKEGDPKHNDFTAEVYVDVRGVRNPSTKGRNVRYRLAASPGWECTFTLCWDKTIVARPQMQAILNDASVLTGLGDGRAVGNGRFDVVAFEELTDAEETTAEGSMASAPVNRVGKGRKEMQALPNGASD